MKKSEKPMPFPNGKEFVSKKIKNFKRIYIPELSKQVMADAYIFDDMDDYENWMEIQRKRFNVKNEKKTDWWVRLLQPYCLIKGLEIENVFFENYIYKFNKVTVYIDMSYGDVWYTVGDSPFSTIKTDFPLKLGNVIILDNEYWNIPKLDNKKDLFTYYIRAN